jgi:hypothetical protein
MTLILSIHPAAQLAVIILGYYAMYLGFQRVWNLHFGKSSSFLRDRHVIVGSISLISMLGGIAAGFIMVKRFLVNPEMGLHVTVALVMLPLGLFGIFSGFFLYLNLSKRKILPALHGINNGVVLLLALLQIVTGIAAYQRYVLQ